MADVACYLISQCVFALWSVLCPAASSGRGSAAVSQGAAGGPAEGPAAGAEGGGAGGEERSHGGRARAAGQTHGGKRLSHLGAPAIWYRTSIMLGDLGLEVKNTGS